MMSFISRDHNIRPKHEFRTSTGPELRTYMIECTVCDRTGREIQRKIPEHVADDERLIRLVGDYDDYFIVKGV